MPENNEEQGEPVALPCYEQMAEEYAAAVDTKPYNAYYKRILELQPTDEFRSVDPEGYERLSTHPWFLIVRARRDLPES